MLLINNYVGGWKGDQIAKVLGDEKSSQSLADQVSSRTFLVNADGVSLDFENLPESSQDDFLKFIKKLRGNMAGKKISVHFYKVEGSALEISKVADEIILMAYDQHSSQTAPGPIGGADWTERLLLDALRLLPAKKIVIGMANYAYDWKTNGSGASISNSAAVLLAKKYQAQILVDPSSQNEYFKYNDQNGIGHEVWLANAQSLKVQINAVKKYEPVGYALYRMGSEDENVWKVFGVNPN
jgi:spore germination protein YaaH